MRILVCVSYVPDTTSKISFTNGDTELNAAGVQFVIGPYDEYALARAVELKEAHGADVEVINVGTEETEPILRKALAIGADVAVRIHTKPTDAMQVASLIAGYAKDKSFDLILCGRESIDYNGGQVHGMLGELLGIPSVSPVMKLELNGTTALMQKEAEGGKETVEVALPLVAGCQEPIAEWKIPSMRGIMSAKTKPLNVLQPEQVTVNTKVKAYALPPARSGVKLIDASEAEKLIDLLKNEAKVL